MTGHRSRTNMCGEIIVQHSEGPVSCDRFRARTQRMNNRSPNNGKFQSYIPDLEIKKSSGSNIESHPYQGSSY